MPAVNHGRCIHLLGLDICFEYNYHDSLQAGPIDETGHCARAVGFISCFIVLILFQLKWFMM